MTGPCSWLPTNLTPTPARRGAQERGARQREAAAAAEFRERVAELEAALAEAQRGAEAAAQREASLRQQVGTAFAARPRGALEAERRGAGRGAGRLYARCG